MKTKSSYDPTTYIQSPVNIALIDSKPYTNYLEIYLMCTGVINISE